MIIGAATPSFDKETKVNNTFETNHLSTIEITNTAQKFIGQIDQKPPIFSAIKINGIRAYKRARKNETADIKPKQVTISNFDLTHIELPIVEFRVTCSKGTYIRSMVDDFGKELNNGAYLNSLRRTRIGKFHINKALTLEELLKKK